MSKPFVPIETADLQWTQDLPISNQYDDIYHAMDSGIKQNRYIFIDGNDLINRWTNLSKEQPEVFTIGEMGFGTGLSFLLTCSLWAQHAPKTASLHYISCEKHPLKLDDINRALSNWPELDEFRLELIKQYPVLTPGNHHLYFCHGRIKLTLMLGDCLERFEQLLLCGDSLLEHQLQRCFVNAWYLDGFAPKKNESMWSRSLLQVLAMLSEQGTTFATYSVASCVKSTLTEFGFELAKKKGYGYKRHMLTGRMEQIQAHRLKQRDTPWHVGTKKEPKEKTALVVGGGLAGCFAAHSLAQRGWSVTLIDENDSVGQGASANQRAVLFPKLSAFRSPLTEFMLASFIYAHRIYSNLLAQKNLGKLNGALVLPYNAKEQNAQRCLEPWLSFYPELGQLIHATKATELSGVNLTNDGLFIPYSGWINSPELCNHLIQDERIRVVTKLPISALSYDADQWVIEEHRAAVLILANGYKVNQFEETRHLPVKPIRGQMTAILSTKDSDPLKIPVCGEGHVLPSVNGVHHLGATYELGASHSDIKYEDDQINLDKLKLICSNVAWSRTPLGSWSGVRASTPDYLPLVGQVAKADSFLSRYEGLESNANRWVAKEAPCYPGLYIFAGFGSRGLTTIPLAAEWLAGIINNELIGAPRNLLHALSPSRFLRRAITRGLIKK